MTIEFEERRFPSGEISVQLSERIDTRESISINWNWFESKDILVPLMKADAIKRQYGDTRYINLNCNYLPYARQDRVFNAGNPLAIEVLLTVLATQFRSVYSMGVHCHLPSGTPYFSVGYSSLNIESYLENYNLVFPDKSAKNHYYTYITCNSRPIPEEFIYFEKTRKLSGIQSTIVGNPQVDLSKKFLIADDICGGGITFINASHILKENYGEEIIVELMIYHAFLDYGLQSLKDSGISKIKIINPESYEYICNLYPNDLDYFEYIDLSSVNYPNLNNLLTEDK